MRLFAIALVSLLGSACTTYATPNLIGGQYYMVGDKNCHGYTLETETSIQCFSSKGQAMGSRSAMTAYDMQNYQIQMAYQMQQINQMQATIAANNAQMQQQTQQTLSNMSSYRPPAVYAPSLGGSVTATCTNAGNYLSCQSALPAANFSCIQAGSFYHCRYRQ